MVFVSPRRILMPVEVVVATVTVAVGGLSLPATYLLRHLHTRRLLSAGYTPVEVALLLRAQRVLLVMRRDE